MSHDIATEEADDGALDRCVLCDLTGKRVDVKEATCTPPPGHDVRAGIRRGARCRISMISRTVRSAEATP